MDSFVCGICQITFHKLEKFLEHKQSQGNDKITSAADNKTVVDFGGGMVMESVSQIMIPASHETAAFHTGVNMVSHNNIELSASTVSYVKDHIVPQILLKVIFILIIAMKKD
ncbi:hypothetical protein OTU49_000368 [Cherax quadricarinatus]|uniref:C2H2-type domain-containing protein n=1 Tax=Cherax quadricarinatus TaxID=27406 RepID=A0AAW0XS13_CHEQU